MTSAMKNISNLVVEVGGAWGRVQTQEVSSTHLTMGRETILGPPLSPAISARARYRHAGDQSSDRDQL